MLICSELYPFTSKVCPFRVFTGTITFATVSREAAETTKYFKCYQYHYLVLVFYRSMIS